MVHKVALLAAALVASLVLAVALAVAGFGPAAPVPPAATTTQTADAETAPPVQVDRVYIAAPQPPQTITVHKTVQGAGGEAESEGSEAGD